MDKQMNHAEHHDEGMSFHGHMMLWGLCGGRKPWRTTRPRGVRLATLRARPMATAAPEGKSAP